MQIMLFETVHELPRYQNRESSSCSFRPLYAPAISSFQQLLNTLCCRGDCVHTTAGVPDTDGYPVPSVKRRKKKVTRVPIYMQTVC